MAEIIEKIFLGHLRIRLIRRLQLITRRVADSFYSGTLLRSAPAIQSTGDSSPELIKKLSFKRSRTVLTSGGVEPVVDQGANGHSVFANAFLRASCVLLDADKMLYLIVIDQFICV